MTSVTVRLMFICMLLKRKKKHAVLLLDRGPPQVSARVMILLYSHEFPAGIEPPLTLHCSVKSGQGYQGRENSMQPICPSLVILWKEFLSDTAENLKRWGKHSCCPFRLLRFEPSSFSYLAYFANILAVGTNCVSRSFQHFHCSSEILNDLWV